MSVRLICICVATDMVFITVQVRAARLLAVWISMLLAVLLERVEAAMAGKTCEVKLRRLISVLGRCVGRHLVLTLMPSRYRCCCCCTLSGLLSQLCLGSV